MYFAAAGISNLIEEWVLDGDTRRFGLVVVLPVVAAVSIVSNVYISQCQVFKMKLFLPVFLSTTYRKSFSCSWTGSTIS